MLLNICYPTTTAASAYSIDYQKLYRHGVRGIIFDIDNTLVPHGAPADERAAALFRRLRDAGVKTCLLSNNNEARVQMFNEDIHTAYICDAHKPSKKGVRAAMRQMGTGRRETVLVGDQIFTDILGANLAKVKSILVSPIHPKEEIQIVLKRQPEKLVLWCYRRYRQKMTGKKKCGKKK